MYCSSCGEQLLDGQTQCVKCGNETDAPQNQSDNSEVSKKKKSKLGKKTKVIIISIFSVILVSLAGLSVFMYFRMDIKPPIFNKYNKYASESLSKESKKVVRAYVVEMVNSFNNRDKGNSGLIYHSAKLIESYEKMCDMKKSTNGLESEMINSGTLVYLAIFKTEIDNASDTNYDDKALNIEKTKGWINDLINFYYGDINN